MPSSALHTANLSLQSCWHAAHLEAAPQSSHSPLPARRLLEAGAWRCCGAEWRWWLRWTGEPSYLRMSGWCTHISVRTPAAAVLLIVEHTLDSRLWSEGGAQQHDHGVTRLRPEFCCRSLSSRSPTPWASPPSMWSETGACLSLLGHPQQHKHTQAHALGQAP